MYGKYSMEFTIEKVNLEVFALLFGMALVDASIIWEPHLVRGEN